MRLQPEAHDSYVSKFVQDFAPEVLKKVAKIEINTRKAPPAEELVDDLFGDSKLTRDSPTYSIQDDCSALIRFHLQGNVQLFARYDFLGKPWKTVNGSVEVHLKGHREAETNRMNLVNLSDELDRALRAFTAAQAAARIQLIQLTNNSYWERVRLEEVLKEYQIRREDPEEEEAEDYGQIPS